MKDDPLLYPISDPRHDPAGGFSVPLQFTIPVGEMRCAVCGKEPVVGEEFQVVLRAGSAWKDGCAELVEGAEMYTAETYCSEHKPPEER